MKMRDAAGVLRTVSAVHMRDAANVLRTVPAIHMRDASNALKSAYSAAGGAPPVTVSPSAQTSSSNTNFANTSSFTASFVGGTPSSIVWSVENVVNATASVSGGQGTATANITVTTADNGSTTSLGSCTVRCTVVIGGVTYSATATKQHTFRYTGGGPAF